METSLSLIAAKALPGLMTESLTYNAAKNVFLTKGWTSMAGNTYYRALRGQPDDSGEGCDVEQLDVS